MKAELINFELWHTYDDEYNSDKIHQYKVKLALRDIETAIKEKKVDTIVGLMLIDGFLYSNNEKFYDALKEIEYEARKLGIKNFFLLPGMCSSISYQTDINSRGLSYKVIPNYDASAQQMFLSYKNKKLYNWNSEAKKFLFLGGVPSRANRVGLLSRYYDAGLLSNAEWSFFPPWTDDDKKWCREYLKKYSDTDYNTFIQNCSRSIDDRYDQSKDYSRLTGKQFKDSDLLKLPWLQDPSYIDSSVYHKTCLSIVSKFEYDNADHHRFLGEKTWRAVINKHPFIIADNSHSDRFDYMKSINLRTFDNFTVNNYGYIQDEETRLSAIVESTNMFMTLIHDNKHIINNDIEHNYGIFLQIVDQNNQTISWIQNMLGVDSLSINHWLGAKGYECFIRVPE